MTQHLVSISGAANMQNLQVFYACLQHSGKKLPFEYHQTFNCQKYVIANHLLDVS